MKHFSLPKDGGLIEKGLPKDILHSREKVYAEICETPFEACQKVCDEIIAEINAFNKLHPGELFKLGLTTGSTPVSLYKDLRRAYNEGKVSFKNVRINTIDEFYPVSAEAKHSRNFILREELLNHIDVAPENILIPDATISLDEVSDYCSRMETELRGLDLLVMGVGEQGQVGFNEAGSTNLTRSRLVHLPYKSRKRQRDYFGGDISKTPSMALTMGVGTMLTAHKVILMAWGENKAGVVARVVEGEMGPDCPASYFQLHENAKFYVDENSGCNLTRVVAPWCIGPCEWTPKFRRKAVVWLCGQVHKPILKLSYQDYLQNSLGGLIESCGAYDAINIQVFNDLQHTITGWPGGKPNADDTYRPERANPFPKKVIVFSPHPDDDVISMGGTIRRLVQQNHDVHVAYETSGNIAVGDEEVTRFMHFINGFNQIFADSKDSIISNKYKEIKNFFANKKESDFDTRDILTIKGLIRRGEARTACTYNDIPLDHVHFLDLPFYESGKIEKLPMTEKDVEVVRALLQKVKPHQIYVAGDLADPHGTHKKCTDAVLAAIDEEKKAGAEWLKDCRIWMYRGAWAEWEIENIEMCVPLSPEELRAKRNSILKHQSQMESAPFLGNDERLFWQRAEDRNRATASLYDKLGLACYEAMEAFVEYKPL